MSAIPYDYLFKFISVGDSGVGKSALLLQLTTNKYTQTESTIGIEFGVQTIQINNKVIKLQVWDTAGQESFKAISRAYYRNASGCLLVFDVSRRETFEHLQDWLKDVLTFANESIKIIVVANKCDYTSRRVGEVEGREWATRHKLMYIESSAKTKQNAFEQLASDVFEFADLKRDLSQFSDNEIKSLEGRGVRVGPRRPLIMISDLSPPPISSNNISCCQ